MKPILVPLIIALTSSQPQADNDVLFDAMNDELARTVAQLKIEKHDKPYYVSYRIDDCDSLNTSASFGAITSDTYNRYRVLSVDVHVGSYGLDSGNMNSTAIWEWEPQSAASKLTLDNDYDAIRHTIWLRTDSAYKKAVRNLEKKKALLQQKNIKERPDDWSHEKPTVLIQPRVTASYNRAEWRERVKNLSAIFKDYPKIRRSSISLAQVTDNKYFINNEGSKSRVVEGDCTLAINATAQAKDGLKLSDSQDIEVIDAQHLPSDEQLKAAINQFAQRLSTIVDAKEGELYQGPVLLEGEAAAEFFNRSLAPNVVVNRPADADRSLRTEDAVMGRIGWRILPKFINVEEDPTLRDATGARQPASYEVDDQGVPAKKVVLVEKGILKTLLSSRLPTLKVKSSNGHALGTNDLAQSSNLIIQPDRKAAPNDVDLDPEKLKAKLIEFGKEDGLDYVLVVRKLSNSPLDGSQGMFFSVDTGGFESKKEQLDLPMALDVSRLYLSDGHEELLRGAEFATTTVRILREIAATGDDSKMYQKSTGTSMDSFDTEAPSYRPASITTPSIILRDMEVLKTHTDVDKPPILSHPFFEKAQAK